jgi:hypothetical protein
LWQHHDVGYDPGVLSGAKNAKMLGMRRVHMPANGSNAKKSQAGWVRAWMWRFAGRYTADINSVS